MTRYVIDAGTAIRLASDQVALLPDDELLAPTLIRSQVLSQVQRAVRAGHRERQEAEGVLTRIRAMRIRLLGDRVLQSVAWKLADQLKIDTFDAEYIALTTLQADALITADPELATAAAAVVDVAPIDVLYPES